MWAIISSKKQLTAHIPMDPIRLPAISDEIKEARK
jgi:hypothetical protein